MKLFKNEFINFSENKSKSKKILTDDVIDEKYASGEVRIVTEQARYPLNTISHLVNDPSYILNPEFQRRQRWPNIKKSRLIESFIMNVPVPPIFLYEVDYSTYEIMDGLQRLTSIEEFYKDVYELEGLEEWPELNGKRYSTLPDKVKRGIDRRYLSSIILLQETAKEKDEADRLKQMVFERINSGGVELKPQESRNAIYDGPLNKLCIKLSRNKKFCKMWMIPEITPEEEKFNKIPKDLSDNKLYKTMEDVELVLRFFAFRQVEKYEGGKLNIFFDIFLKNGNRFEENILSQYEVLFNETIDLVYEIFGESAFCIYKTKNDINKWAKTPTKLIYDPIMYVFSENLHNKKKLIQNKKEIKKDCEKFYKTNKDFFEGKYTNKADIQNRILLISDFIRGYIK